MFDYFRFSLPRAVTEQLLERLGALKRSQLTPEELENLALFQSRSDTSRGVYLIYQAEQAVYAGKTDELAQRLSQHLRKLSGRESLHLAAIGCKALLLDENWSTSANEDLLINHFKTKGECKWNGTGFGPKDPGKNRDGDEPNWFDNTYPVSPDYPITGVSDGTTVGVLLEQIKNQVPDLIRYDLPGKSSEIRLKVRGTPRTARELLIATGKALGSGWQLMLFKHGFTLYRANHNYANGVQLLP